MVGQYANLYRDITSSDMDADSAENEDGDGAPMGPFIHGAITSKMPPEVLL